MHEGPVTEEIIRIACEAAAAQQGRVTAISLVVGEDSGFIGESIQMYFDVMSEGTVCEGAVLHLECVKPKLRCTRCGQLFYAGLLVLLVPPAAVTAGLRKLARNFM